MTFGKTTKLQLAFVFALLAAAASAARAADAYVIDPVHSTAQFKVKHLGISNVRGGFSDFSGTIAYDAKNASKSSVEFTVKTASVDTNNDKRDDHLRAPDFFDVEKYPTMTFKSEKVEKTGADTLRVTGKFTLHGVTKTITMDVEKTGEGEDPKRGRLVGFETEFSIKRSDYGMSGSIPAVSDAVKITIAVEAAQEKPKK